MEVVRAAQGSGDAALQKAARAVLQGAAPAVPGRDDPRFRIVQEQSGDPRREAAAALAAMPYTPKTGQVFQEAILDARERLAVRESLVNQLGTFDHPDAAEVLAGLARRADLLYQLREDAILALNRMTDREVSRRHLRDLGATLTDPDLRELAATLAR
jgi:uncharacterized protein YjiS (DUF1127 family)